MRVDGPETSPVAFDNMAKRTIRDNNDWSRYEIVLDLPAEAVQIAYGVILGGRGRLWVDDLMLEIVSADYRHARASGSVQARSAVRLGAAAGQSWL